MVTPISPKNRKGTAINPVPPHNPWSGQPKDSRGLVGVHEVSKILGITRQRVNKLVQDDPKFPKPVAELACGRIWEDIDIHEYARARRDRRKKVYKCAMPGCELDVVRQPHGHEHGKVVRFGKNRKRS